MAQLPQKLLPEKGEGTENSFTSRRGKKKVKTEKHCAAKRVTVAGAL